MGLWPANQVRAFAALLLLLIAGLAVGFYRHGRTVESEITLTAARPQRPVEPRPMTRPLIPAALPLEHVVVHVAGAVVRPGVYRLALDSRNEDAIKAAGGAKKEADLDAINLAAVALDGSRLYVPRKTDGTDTGSPVAPTETTPSVGRSAQARSAKFAQPGRDHLNLNTASAEALQRLPGVGPAMASRIIEHRKENGPFTDVEQLMDVSGIGEKKFAKMKPYVRTR